MIFLLQEEIDDYETFSTWFNGEAVPKIEAAGDVFLFKVLKQKTKKCFI